jgi:uncharacterized membrane protein
MVVLRSVGGGSGSGGFVPRIAVTVAFGFVLASVALFISYISHVANLIRVATIITHIGRQARRILDRRYPAFTAGTPAAGTSGPRAADGRWRDGTGQLRLVPQYRFADFLDLAVGEIWRYGADAAQVPGRLATMLADLHTAALPACRPAIAAWSRQVKAARP